MSESNTSSGEQGPEYLQGPHIQLGSYWHGLPDIEAYRRVLRWFVGVGYRAHPVVTLMKADNGVLPRYDQLATHGLPEGTVIVRGDCSLENVLSEQAWLPVRVRLLPSRLQDVEIDVGYAFMHEESLRAGDRRVVEITASGADLNLLDNSGVDDLDPEVVQAAQRVEEWHWRVFHELCDDLLPDYAGLRWEWEIQPPASLLSGCEVDTISSLYLSEELTDPAMLCSAFSDLDAWSIDRWQHGCYVQLNNAADIDAANKGKDMICNFVRQGLARRL